MTATTRRAAHASASETIIRLSGGDRLKLLIVYVTLLGSVLGVGLRLHLDHEHRLTVTETTLRLVTDHVLRNSP